MRSSVITPNDETLLILGMADEVTSEFNDSGSAIHFEGRDLRGILMDSSVPPEVLTNINITGQRLNELIEELLHRFFPQGEGIQVKWSIRDWPKGPPIVLDDRDVNSEQKDATSGEKVQTTAPGNAQSLKFWDLIIHWCFISGAVPYFFGSQLRLRASKSLYDYRLAERSFDPNFPAPFKGSKPRQIGPPTGDPEPAFWYRRLVFGRDMREIKFSRKLGGVVVPAVCARAVDMDNMTRGVGKKTKGIRDPGRFIEYTYPPEVDPAENTPQTKAKHGRRASVVGPSGEGARTEVIFIPVHGVTNVTKLEEIAKAVHAEVSRQEIGGSFSTKSLGSFGGNNQDPDLLKLRPGDPIEIRTVDNALTTYPPFIAEPLDHTRRSDAEEEAALTKRLGAKLARAIVMTSRGKNQQLTRTFRANTVRFNWSKDGIGIESDFQNFVEVRNVAPEDRSPTGKG
jgi:hypothetical protein